MSTADSQSSFDLGLSRKQTPDGASNPTANIWLDGDVLSCACPDCSAPMSIRLWLLVADCWRCGASIELTEEQEREALRLLEQQTAVKQASAKPNVAGSLRDPVVKKPARTQPPPERPLQDRERVSEKLDYIAPPPKPTPAAAPRRQVASHGNRLKAQLRDLDERGEVELFWRAVFRDMYAWLASLVIHLVLLILLAILMIEPLEETKPTLEIVLATQAADTRREGGVKAPKQEDPIEFEKPAEEDKKQDAPEEKPQDPTPDEKVEEEKPDPGPELGNKPEPRRTAGSGTTAAAVNPAMIAGRKSTSRAQLVRQEGGTSATEAAVARGLHWLANHQNDDGSWSLDKFNRSGECRGRCSHTGFNSDTAGTALALLPFLGAGQTHRQGQYKKVVEAGLQWLVDEQLPNGDLPSRFRNSHMYAHGQGAIALCEAYALTQDKWLKEPAQKSIDFIIDAQHSRGGWRYQPGDRGDTSVVGWQLMALRSAQMAYLDVPPEALERAMKYLDDAQTDSAGGRYAYMPGNNTSHVMTAEALLCRQYAGWPQNHPGLVEGVRYLLDSHLPKSSEKLNLYYVYYATQVMHHMGGDSWGEWNYRMRDILVQSQETRGHEAGSWTPEVGHDLAGGRVYQTALAVCTLEVYYRHLPLYRQIAAEK